MILVFLGFFFFIIILIFVPILLGNRYSYGWRIQIHRKIHLTQEMF